MDDIVKLENEILNLKNAANHYKKMDNDYRYEEISKIIKILEGKLETVKKQNGKNN